MSVPKQDLKKELKRFYAPRAVAGELTLPALNFLMIDGIGAPESPAFSRAIEALFSVSYTVKFGLKRSRDYDYTVMPLEGLWWADDMDDFAKGTRSAWRWTLMIMQPEAVTPALFEAARDEVIRKKKIAEAQALRFEPFEEGRAVQLLHVGPFATEPASIQKIHLAIAGLGGSFDGLRQKHHEIYLSDFRKVDPAKMKTIIRQPFNIL